MTCKDCLHYEVCFALIKNGLPYLDDECLAETFCLEFKDKSKYIELPCKIGDTVYDVVLCDDNIYRIIKMIVSNVVPFGSPDRSQDDAWNLYLTDTYTYAYRSFYDIGKTVFFTYEEAEKKIKELKNNV